MSSCTCSLQGPDENCARGKNLFHEVESRYLLIEEEDFPKMFDAQWRENTLLAYEEDREIYFKHIGWATEKKGADLVGVTGDNVTGEEVEMWWCGCTDPALEEETTRKEER